ncbi:hypothetical protein [Agilicoccus flavus]|uniref:hypothetical protein n=1 Tax=Agilicoccus flavus TaxID=2775968 RepID=UPI001CF6BFA7|nr:hypothetical protein [Agilicoccus flavus]
MPETTDEPDPVRDERAAGRTGAGPAGDERTGDEPTGESGAGPERRGVVYVPVRRSVNYRAFLLTGAVVGLLLGLAFDAITPQAPAVTATSAAAYVAVIGALLGTLVGAIVALLLDRRR